MAGGADKLVLGSIGRMLWSSRSAGIDAKELLLLAEGPLRTPTSWHADCAHVEWLISPHSEQITALLLSSWKHIRHMIAVKAFRGGVSGECTPCPWQQTHGH
jgi:hypothetical protein